jgi:hypothetical protein
VIYFLSLTRGGLLAIVGATSSYVIISHLFRALDSAEPGDVIELSVVRDGASDVLGRWEGEGARTADTAEVYETVGLTLIARAS